MRTIGFFIVALVALAFLLAFTPAAPACDNFGFGGCNQGNFGNGFYGNNFGNSGFGYGNAALARALARQQQRDYLRALQAQRQFNAGLYGNNFGNGFGNGFGAVPQININSNNNNNNRGRRGIFGLFR